MSDDFPGNAVDHDHFIAVRDVNAAGLRIESKIVPAVGRAERHLAGQFVLRRGVGGKGRGGGERDEGFRRRAGQAA